MFDAQLLLRLWETNWNRMPCEQAVAVISHTQYMAAETASSLVIGSRDQLLFRIYEQLFGSKLDLLATCPLCGEVSELAMGTNGLYLEVPNDQWYSLEYQNQLVRWRLPNSTDLIIASRLSKSAACRELVCRCLEVEQFNRESIPGELVKLISMAMSEQDPQANLELDVSCAACGHQWLLPFDIVSILWANLSSWAQRTLGEIHVLAKAYGWNEAQILAISPVRRQIYLNMIAA